MLLPSIRPSRCRHMDCADGQSTHTWGMLLHKDLAFTLTGAHDRHLLLHLDWRTGGGQHRICCS